MRGAVNGPLVLEQLKLHPEGLTTKQVRRLTGLKSRQALEAARAWLREEGLKSRWPKMFVNTLHPDYLWKLTDNMAEGVRYIRHAMKTQRGVEMMREGTTQHAVKLFGAAAVAGALAVAEEAEEEAEAV